MQRQRSLQRDCCDWPASPGCCLGSSRLGIETGVALGVAVIAGSVGLLGLRPRQRIAALASIIVIWRFTGTRLAGASSNAARSGRSQSSVTHGRRIRRRAPQVGQMAREATRVRFWMAVHSGK
jgi:hypothetical protein